MKSVLAFFVVVVVLQLAKEGSAECCGSYRFTLTGYVTLLCLDCSVPTPYCGWGGCNIFGCNCDGGCRDNRQAWCHSVPAEEPSAPARPSRAAERGTPTVRDERTTAHARDVIAAADVDGDGMMDMEEARLYLVGRQLVLSSGTERDLKALDKDGDNYLSLEEIDN